MNRPMMRSYLIKWLQKVWKEIPADPKKASVEAYQAGYEQGYEQRKLETSWRSLDK